MSRLIFAAARKARICRDTHPIVPVNLMWITDAVDHEMSYRIHPEDAHLAYGPISTALREVATDESRLEFDFPEFALHVNVVAKLYDSWASEWDFQTLLERSLALLILAEALADEGL